MRTWVTWLLTVQLLDFFVTIVGLSRGIIEGNTFEEPVVAAAGEVGLFIVKVVFVGVMVLALKVLGRRYQLWPFLVTIFGMSIFAVGYNLWILAGTL